MFELIQARGNSYYIESPAKIGLVRLEDSEVCLIDSGNDKDAGRRVRQLLEANSWSLRAIYNTHSNADHIGGNHYLQEQTGCSIYAPGIERDFTVHPVLEPSFLFGAYPPRELRHKFLLARESRVKELSKDCLPEGFSILPLPGHFFDMVGYRTADNVVYLADCLSSGQTLEKYPISFLYDAAAYLQTLEMVKTLQADLFIPSHAQPAEDIVPLAQRNIAKVYEIAESVIEICKEPLCFEQILQRLSLQYRLQMSFEQYALVGSTVRSYLSWLKDTGRLTAYFENGLLLWERV